jgi:hypothetical protein
VFLPRGWDHLVCQLMDHPAVLFRFILDLERRRGMAFREVLVTQVKEVLRAWLGGAGKRPAASRAGVDVKTAARYIAAARDAGLDGPVFCPAAITGRSSIVVVMLPPSPPGPRLHKTS